MARKYSGPLLPVTAREPAALCRSAEGSAARRRSRCAHEPDQIRRPLEDPHLRQREGALAWLTAKVEVRPAPGAVVERARRRADTAPERLELGDVSGGREHVGPAAGVQILPVHRDHARAPCCESAPAVGTAVRSRASRIIQEYARLPHAGQFERTNRVVPRAPATYSTPMPIDPATAWAAVLERDTAHDARFVYAVRTTGIYCRPSCGSRRPRRENVSFFDAPSAAVRAGFRACRRCRPDAVRPHAATVARACALIDAAEGAPPGLTALAGAAGLSLAHFQRLFRREVGLTPKQYAARRQSGRLKARLKQGDTVTRATFEAGYGAASRVYDRAAAELGMTPATYRRGGRGERISFGVTGTALGRLLVAATERGVCAVALGESDIELEAGLRDEFPHADVVTADRATRAWIAQVVAHLETGASLAAVPIDVRGTAFQWQVWRALRAIPAGTTRSYAEVAAGIGRPSAVRAVAGACADNPVALIIPCHRVVRTDGALGGYRWGIERKRALLAREAGGPSRAESG